MINVLLQLAYFLDAVQLEDDEEKNYTFLDIAGPSRSIDGPDNKLTANVDEHISETPRHPAVCGTSEQLLDFKGQSRGILRHWLHAFVHS